VITTTETGADGRPVVVKRAAGPDDLARLGREARLLHLARHPGVVEVATCAADGGELGTVLAGTRTLAATGLTTGIRLRALAAAAETIADLHALGLVHGRLDESHIVLGPGGRPILCGFAGAGLAGEPDAEGRPRRPGDDVAALGTLVAQALASSDTGTPGPGRSSRWGRGRPGGSARVRLDRSELRRLAQRATDPEPARRPTARRLAAELDRLSGLDRLTGIDRPTSTDRPTGTAHASTPAIESPAVERSEPSADQPPGGDWPRSAARAMDADGPSGPDPTGPDASEGDEIERLLDDIARLRATAPIDPTGRDRARLRTRLAVGIAALVGLGLLVAGGAALSTPSDGARPSVAGPPPVPAVPSVDSGTDDPAPEPAPPPAERHPGGELDLDGHRYVLGTAADLVVVADWGCRGSRTAVLVQPSGAVYRFDGWATTTDLRGVLAGHWPDPASVAVGSGPSGCPVLASSGPGPVVTLDPTSSPSGDAEPTRPDGDPERTGSTGSTAP